MTAARILIERYTLQNRRFYVPGHPVVHYINAAFGEIDTHICLFATYMAKKMDLDDLSCLRPRMNLLRIEN